ncbi:MAG: hypothetical protein JWQ03_1724, partial [Variovorax sp.]|nr:hypothetical protein [Variovorax sp.]
MALGLRDQSGAATYSVALVGTTARAVLLDANSAPITNKLVTFATDAKVAS